MKCVQKRFNDYFGIANVVKDSKRTYVGNKCGVFDFNFNECTFGFGKLNSSGFCWRCGTNNCKHYFVFFSTNEKSFLHTFDFIVLRS